jgi:Family of unknown function (DUF6058)
MATTATYTEADLTYLRGEFRTLAEICARRPETPDEVRRLIAERRLPQPPYVLDDGTELVPPDYFALADAGGGVDGVREEFERRYRAGLERYGVQFDRELFERRWEGYLDGTPAICMRDVTPETVIRKRQLIDEIERLTADPRPDEETWRSSLRAAVDELDALEKPFAPDYDRARFTPTRDTYVRDVREAYATAWT